MPPAIKVNQEAILQAALELTREQGISALTSRSIAQSLQCSTQPIFRVYENMDALKDALLEYANCFFAQYILQSSEENPFFNIGFRYIRFAKEERNLFIMMFLSGSIESQNILTLFTTHKEQLGVMKTIPGFSQYTQEQIKDLFVKIAIFTHGMASLIATNDIAFEDDTIRKLLHETFSALRKNMPTKEAQS